MTIKKAVAPKAERVPVRPMDNEDQRIRHFLNRTTFGATGVEVQEVNGGNYPPG